MGEGLHEFKYPFSQENLASWPYLEGFFFYCQGGPLFPANCIARWSRRSNVYFLLEREQFRRLFSRLSDAFGKFQFMRGKY